MILYTGGHLEIHTPLTDIFIITALYVIYGAATLDSLLSALIFDPDTRRSIYRLSPLVS